MQVKTHSGFEDLDEAKINTVIQEACNGLEKTNWSEVALRCKVNWYDGITTDELADATIMAARSLVETHPDYEFVAARLLLRKLNHEVGLDEFSDYITRGIQDGRLDLRMGHPASYTFDTFALANALDYSRDNLLRYQGAKILYDRYLLRDSMGVIFEKPQWMWMRVAMGIALGEKENHTEWAIKFYNAISTFDYMPSTPTLFNAGTVRPQMASCYVTHVDDSLSDIFASFYDIAQMAKWAGGVGTNWTAVRGTGARIKGTNGEGTGIIPWLKIQNDIAVAVNQGGKRKGSHCAYLEPWHPDIEEFLDLRKPVGDDRRRTHDLDTALWIPDVFMEAVCNGEDWYLFDPSTHPELANSWGDEFKMAYNTARLSGKWVKQVRALDLWKKILNALFETGHPWICFKDACNRANPLTSRGMIRSSNLCTEITLNTAKDETAVCNLGSINLSNMVLKGHILSGKLKDTVTLAVRMLDNIIDGMFYPTQEAAHTNHSNRPIGLGVMGTFDMLVQMNLNFDSVETVDVITDLHKTIQTTAAQASMRLGQERGAFENCKHSSFNMPRRNSYLTAIAPTATISNITGTTPSIEPIYSNLFVKANLSGDFTSLNHWLVADLEKLDLWHEDMLMKLKINNGSIQNIEEIPYDIKQRYRTAFEYDQNVLIDLAAARTPHISQSQSLNLFVPANIKGSELSDLYIGAWKKGIKTTYYLKTKAASGVEKSTVDPNLYGKTHIQTAEIPMCRIDNPDCESCQ